MISSLSGQWNLTIKNISREPSHKCSKGNSVIWMDLTSQSYSSLCLIFPLGRDDILCLDFRCSAHLAWNEGVSFLASRHGWLWMKNMNQPFLGAQAVWAQGSGFLPVGWPQGALFLCFFVLNLWNHENSFECIYWNSHHTFNTQSNADSVFFTEIWNNTWNKVNQSPLCFTVRQRFIGSWPPLPSPGSPVA